MKTLNDRSVQEGKDVPRRQLKEPERGSGKGTGTGGELTKVTVNLVPRAIAALEEVTGLTHDTKTESINRALQLYAWVQRMIDSGHEVHVVSKDGKVMQVQLF